jgi:hypothetical protein
MQVNSVEETRRWVNAFIVGLDLCPFAKRPALHDTIRYIACRGTSEEEWLAEFLHECQILLEEGGPATTLFLLPEQLLHFHEYLSFFDLAQAVLQDSAFDEHIQIVSFHPGYRFEGAEENDPANRTNRSPHPMIHLLKRSDVAKAIEQHPDTEQIPKDNISLLRSMFGAN